MNEAETRAELIDPKLNPSSTNLPHKTVKKGHFYIL